jgi:uncharacterized protein (TIGR01627 family)
MEKLRAHFSVWLAKLVTKLAGITGWVWLVKLMRRLTGTQVTVEQMMAVRQAIKENSACKLLIFGVGNDSWFWMNSNSGGRTVFLEDDDFWLRKVKKRVARIEAYLVDYDSKIEEWKEMIDKPERLEMNFPDEVANTSWDVILVDAPTGWGEGTKGRMKSIYAGRKMVSESGHVFVHDCDREVEIAYCEAILKPENFVKEITATDVGYLRHYKFQA